MATIRRKRHEQRVRVTQEAVDAFRRGDHRALHAALKLKPWQASPLDAEGDCPWREGTGGHATWDDSAALRAEIEAWPR